MLVKKNVVSPLNYFKYSVSRSKLAQMQSQSTYFVKLFWVVHSQTPMLYILIVFHTVSFAVTLSKGLVLYYYMPQASKFLSTGIASTPSYKVIIQVLNVGVTKNMKQKWLLNHT